MLHVAKEVKDGVTWIKFSGAIEENVDLQTQIGEIQTKKAVFKLREVSRINSVGVKNWIKYFQSLHQRGQELSFQECSTAIVEQVNLISNFVPRGSIDSIYVPFCCAQCHTELLGLFPVDDLKRIHGQLPALQCSKCGGRAEFDDVVEEYFSFLDRN